MARFRWIRIGIFAFIVIFFTFSKAAFASNAPVPSMTFTKTANPGAFSQLGEVITYTYLVSTDEQITGLKITDSPLDGPVICDKTTVKANETATCTTTYTIKQADLDRGYVSNKATASGTYSYQYYDDGGCCGCGSGYKTRNGTVSKNASAIVKYDPPVGTPADAVLAETGIYCDAAKKNITLPLASRADLNTINAQLGNGVMVVTIGGRPSSCKAVIADGRNTLSCANSPSTTFPADIKVTMNGRTANEFQFDGATCKTTVLSETGAYCDVANNTINFLLDPDADPVTIDLQLLTGETRVSIGGEPAVCRLVNGATPVVSCFTPASTTFPAAIKVTTSGSTKTEFQFDGAGCEQPPVLSGVVPYCNADSKSMNLALDPNADPETVQAQLSIGLMVVTVGGQPSSCVVVSGTTNVLSCANSPSTTFPADVKVTINGQTANEFQFDGSTCETPPGDPVEVDPCIENPSDPACQTPAEPVYCIEEGVPTGCIYPP